MNLYEITIERKTRETIPVRARSRTEAAVLYAQGAADDHRTEPEVFDEKILTPKLIKTNVDQAELPLDDAPAKGKG